ncbi:hypothetical protein PQ744_01520 [Thermoanaerobacterium thermosaccharolyticum]|uniref:hypothetical protein n=1 Tax=Thermoanaerobacterium thermosaccharolyticum TaxID=1517 RepID=UPI003D292CE6
MDRPYIICHMVTSLDGKITGEFLKKVNTVNSLKTTTEYIGSTERTAFFVVG